MPKSPLTTPEGEREEQNRSPFIRGTSALVFQAALLFSFFKKKKATKICIIHFPLEKDKRGVKKKKRTGTVFPGFLHEACH